MACSCKRCNEPTDFIKCGAFPDWPRTGYLLKKASGPWSSPEVKVIKYISTLVRKSVNQSVTLGVSH